MANYQIPMTGAQITDALTQLVNRVAEGWAVGSRDGNPVTSGSPYYHNNAKYYAENAQDAAARAEAAVPASTAGAVFFDRSQSLTDAQKMQAKKNIGAGSTNPNLLDNWWWGTGVVNQRGVTSGTEFGSNIFRMDRWSTTWGASSTGGTWSLDADGLTINANTSAEYFWQDLGASLDEALMGKQVCASFMLPNGTIYQSTLVRTGGTQFFSNIGLAGIVMDITNTHRFQIGVGNGYSATFKAVKLEIGSVSTLAMDLPPNPKEELIRCITSTVYPADLYTDKVVTATTNRNLLDNGWFSINQRNFTTGNYSHKAYRMDRWYTTYSTNTSGTLTLANGVVTMDMTNGTSANFIVQLLDSDTQASIAGKIITASILMSDNTIISGSGLAPAGSVDVVLYNNDGLVVIYGKTNGFRISVDGGKSFSFKAVKLELGSVSTLYLDAAPNPAEELAKCQFYFQRIYGVTNHPFAFGMAWDSTHIRGLIPLASPLRVNGGSITVSLSGTLGYAGNGSTGNIASIDSVLNYFPYNGSCCLVFTTASNVSQYQNYVIRAAASGAYIDISADL